MDPAKAGLPKNTVIGFKIYENTLLKSEFTRKIQSNWRHTTQKIIEMLIVDANENVIRLNLN